MPEKQDNAGRSLLDAAAVRHAVGVAVTLVLNVAVIVLLATWAGRRRPEGRPSVRAIPLSVVRTEPEAAELNAPRPSVEPVVLQPEPAPALPPLPRPALAAPTALLDTPAPMQMALPQRTDVPPYAARAAAPVAARPVPLPGRAPARPGVPRPGRPSGTRGPVLLGRPNLADYYPRRALRRGTAGQTRIRLTIDAAGRVTDVQVVTSRPPGVFEHAAGRVGRVLPFRPALRAGRPVAAVVSLNLVWKVE
jgi:protein TonB